MKALIINAGSSSHKLSLFEKDNPNSLWKCQVDWGRGQKSRSYTIEVEGKKEKYPLEFASMQAGLEAILQQLWQGSQPLMKEGEAIACIGHRVVHGGSRFQLPVLIDASVKEGIKKLIPLAPLHNPANLEGIVLMETLFPNVPQIAVFDTAFHASMPEVAKTYPVPFEWRERGVQRYGFHGISHKYCAERAAELLPGASRMINCHLGNGASLCALLKGKSIDTTMGLTPLEGLMMGTRCGSIDPGIVFYMMREYQMSPQELDYVLNFESGLKGIAGGSDMRDAMSQSDERSRLAVDMYLYRLKASIGALTACLGGMDALIFTAGVGENSSQIRQKTCENLAYLGIRLDPAKNEGGGPDRDIAAADSPCRVLVIHTQEEWLIAKECFQKLNS